MFHRWSTVYTGSTVQQIDIINNTARWEKEGGRHFFHQVEPNWPLPYSTVQVPQLRDARQAGWVTFCSICASTMPRAQNRTAKGSTLMEDETLYPSGYIIYLWFSVWWGKCVPVYVYSIWGEGGRGCREYFSRITAAYPTSDSSFSPLLSLALSSVVQEQKGQGKFPANRKKYNIWQCQNRMYSIIYATM